MKEVSTSSLVLSLIMILLLGLKREGREPCRVVLLVLHVWVSLGMIVAAVLLATIIIMTILRLTHNILSVLDLLDGLRLVNLDDLAINLDPHSHYLGSSWLRLLSLSLLLRVLAAPALAPPLLVSLTSCLAPLLPLLLLELHAGLLDPHIVVYGELVELVHLCLMLLASGLQLFLLLLKLPLSVLDRLPLGIRGSQLSFVPINKALTKQHLFINN